MYCNQSKASLEDMVADLNQQFDSQISKEALHKKFSTSAVRFLEELIKKRLQQQFTAHQSDQLNHHFPGIIIKDSSRFSLPSTYDGAYPSYGNFSKKNGLMNLQYEYDLVHGRWLDIKLTNNTSNDQNESNQTIDQIEKGNLYLRDLGYITPTYLKAVIKKGAYYLNRLPGRVNLYTPDQEPIDWLTIHNKFNKLHLSTMDVEVLIYHKDRLPCRLVIERVDDTEYNNRLKKAKDSAKSRGVGISKTHKVRCRYNTFITNVTKEVLPSKTIRKTYYLRWQIELVFKTWKSFFKINETKKVKKQRLECQILAKFLWILLNWNLFNICNAYVKRKQPTKGISVLKFFKRCIAFSYSFRMVILKKITLNYWIKDIFLPLIENTLCEAPKNKITHYKRISMLFKTLS